MSRYKRKYTKFRIPKLVSSENEVYYNSRSYADSDAPQLSSDSLVQPPVPPPPVILTDMTEWGVFHGARSIYDFDSNDPSPLADRQGANAAIFIPDPTGVSTGITGAQGLLGVMSINTSSSKGTAYIKNLDFGRTKDRTLVIVSNIAYNTGKEYFGGPGIIDDTTTFAVAGYNPTLSRIVVGPTNYDQVPDSGFLEKYVNYITAAQDGRLNVAMIRWDHSESEISIRYKAFNDLLTYSYSNTTIAGTSSPANFYFGAIGGSPNAEAGTNFYWAGFFDSYLTDDDFDEAVDLIGI